MGRSEWLGGVYVVDVGVTRPVNAGIESVDLSHHTVPIGGAVSVTAAVNAVGATEKETRTVDLFLVNKTGKKVPRGSMEVTLEKGNTTTATFLADGLSGPFVQGEVRLRSSDPLDVDDAGYFTIGVAGTHGKTTTASMLSSILKQREGGSSMLIGGALQGRVQAGLGDGELFVVEADEFDRSFLYLHPSAVIITTIDAEHLDCYCDLNGVRDAFVQFLGRLPFYGRALVGGDDPDVRNILQGIDRSYCTFGLADGNDFRAENIKRRDWGCFFELFFRRSRLHQEYCQMNLPINLGCP